MSATRLQAQGSARAVEREGGGGPLHRIWLYPNEVTAEDATDALLRLIEQEDLNLCITNRIFPRRLTTQAGRVQPDRAALGARLSTPCGVSFRSRFERKRKNLISPACTIASSASSMDGARAHRSQPRGSVRPCVTRSWRGRHRPSQRPTRSRDSLHIGGPSAITLSRDAFAKRPISDRCGCSSMYHRFHAPNDCRVDEVT